MGKQRVTMRSLVDKWGISVLALFFIMKALQIAGRLGIRRKDDSWRRCMAPFFLTEHAKFIIAAFRLDFSSDVAPGAIIDLETAKRHLIGRLALFLRGHPDVRWKLTWGFTGTKRSRIQRADIIHVVFDDRGRLDNLEFYPNPAGGDGQGISPTIQGEIVGWVREAYNETFELPDTRRPAALARKIGKRCGVHRWSSRKERNDAARFVERLLTGTYVQFSGPLQDGEPGDPTRFSIPDLSGGKHPGFGVLNIYCRFSDHYREADLWFQASHVLVDGAIVQNFIKELKKEWGTRGIVKIPSLSEAGGIALQRCSSEWAKEPIYEGKMLVDFQDLLAIRNTLTRLYLSKAGGNITLASMLTWGLARTEPFAGIKFLIPVDIRSPKSFERTLCHVIIRPETYFTTVSSFDGFLAYQREFNRRLRAAKEGRGEVQEMLDAFALNPPFVNAVVYRLMPSAVHELFGCMVITVLKESDLFVCPFDDIHTRGSIAFGSMTMPTKNGGEAGWVTARGEKDRIDKYLNSVSVVVKHFQRYLQAPSLVRDSRAREQGSDR
jgi:hypothetical protein